MNTKKIALIVDDDNDVLSLFREKFEKKGCDVTTSSRAEEAISILNNQSDVASVAFVLTDIHTDELTGGEEGFRVVEACDLKKIPVLIMSGSDTWKKENQKMAQGRSFLKPLSKTDIEAIVTEGMRYLS